jgi:hypothetical protein
MPNIFSAVASTFTNAIGTFLSYALPLLALAILGLLVAIAAVNFIFGLFGFKLGISEKFRENLRRKLKQNKKSFPFAIKSRKRDTGKQAAAKSPWTDPGLSVFTESELFDAESIDGDLDYFKFCDYSGKFAPFSDEDFIFHANSVDANWSSMFSQYKSLDGLLSARNLDDRAKGDLFTHAARLIQLKKDAINDNIAEWSKQYGDGMPSQPVQFVA